MRILTNKNDRPEIAIAYEEAVCLARLNEKTPDTLWIWRHPSAIYLMNNSSINFLDTDYAKKIKYPIIRSAIFNGKTTSSIIAGTDIGLLYAGKQDFGDIYKNLYQAVFGQFLELENKANDLVLRGTDKKISGIVSAKQGDVFFGHCTFLETMPQIDFNKLFKVPPEKFAGKTVSSPADRVVDYNTATGKMLSDNEIVGALKNIGMSIEQSDFTPDELQMVQELTNKHISDKWIKYGKNYEQPDFF